MKATKGIRGILKDERWGDGGEGEETIRDFLSFTPVLSSHPRSLLSQPFSFLLIQDGAHTNGK